MKRALASVVVAAAAIGCRSPTEIHVEVTTDVACADWKGSAIAVGELGPGLEQAVPSTSSTTCDATGHVGSVVVIPSGDDGVNVAFRVVGAVDHGLEACTEDAGYAGCIVARRALRFIPHETLTLAVPLEASCKDVPCTADETCVNGLCHPATIVDPTQCETTSCGEGALPSPIDDGGPGIDATVNDGGQEDGATTDGDAGDAGSDAPVGPPFEGGAGDGSIGGCGANCAIALGQKYSCAVVSGGVHCWGQNTLGELGNGTGTDPDVTRPVVAGGTPLAGVRGITAGHDTSCAFLADGGGACWGAGSPLGIAGNDESATTESFLADVSMASVANYHMCWVTPGAGLFCQAQGTSGVEESAFDGDGGTRVSVSLAPVAESAIVQMATAAFFTCLLTTDGSVYCLGDNGSFESNPFGSNATITTFTKVALQSAALEIALLDETACARTAGHVFCWGNGFYGQSGGAPDFNEIRYPDGGSVTNAVQLAAGEFHSCARLADAHVACWGNNQEHQLGRGEPAALDGGTSSTAQLVVLPDGGAFSDVSFVAAGGYHSCAFTAEGSLWCWGDNDQGQLGVGDTNARSTPTLVVP